MSSKTSPSSSGKASTLPASGAELSALLREVGSHFRIPGEFVSGSPYGNGHIHSTFAVTFTRGGVSPRFIFQRINQTVFKDPDLVMRNIERVCSHLRARLETDGRSDVARRCLTVIPTRAGTSLHRDTQGNAWRAYVFVEKATSHDNARDVSQAFEAARAFGGFAAMLADLPPPRLEETIPDFHNTPKRFDALEVAVAKDAFDRVRLAGPQIEFALRRRKDAGRLEQMRAARELPERITHNDTKLNNVLLDDATGEGVCVIDLDTVMPGLALYDFGDMVRSGANPVPEDAVDSAGAVVSVPAFEALARGYLSSAGGMLTQAEKDLMPFSAALITLEIGVRFLTDYLSGDWYFKTSSEDHNLRRCRVQFNLAASIEARENELLRIVRASQ